ncbi:MAG TPA: class II fructose-bisphosphate aldolase [Armatimonadota bacterium]|nr:class II fructose-bisphosphate aldolase [Armatimonadota bacterium]
MPLVTSKEIITKGYHEGYAVGAFNAVNMETAQAIIGAATELRSPLIMQITQTTLKYTEFDELAAIAKVLIDRSGIPVALHLDHGRTYEVVMKCLKLGFSSVMIDGSLREDGKTPRTYEENIAITRKVIEPAHALGVTVEGEIGTLGQIGTTEAGALTDPDQAAQFVEDTGVDTLAVAIGTTHGLYRGKPFIDIERLKAIRAKVGIPLVLHGGTGTPDDSIRAAIQNGIAKINIDTFIRVAFYEAVGKVIDEARKQHEEADKKGEPRKYDIRKILAPAREAMKAAVEDRMKVFGSPGKV